MRKPFRLLVCSWLLLEGALLTHGRALAANPADSPGLQTPHVAKALALLRERRAALGLHGAVDFVPLKARTLASSRLASPHLTPRHYVRLRQTQAGIPVFGAQAVVQLDDAGDVDYMLADLATAPDLDQLTNPSRSSQQAIDGALAWATARHSGVSFTATTPVLEIFAPEVLGAAGAPRLAWILDVRPRETGRPSRAENAQMGYQLLIDAQDGSTIRAYPHAESALNREIYDSQNTTHPYYFLVRREGDPPCAISEANHAYDYIADVYSFYATRHGRDGFDNTGHLLQCNVRLCLPFDCPMINAFWDDTEMSISFGDGMAIDDVTAHEFTHGVTASESGLIYENASGAMNESISDIFGEFVDLTNGHGVDDPSVRWLIGEEMAAYTLRNMSNPPVYGQPDRLRSPLYFPAVPNPDKTNDQGGVHTNSGVGNKLCFLLTDGGSFNGQTVSAMGINAVEALFYEANTNLLAPASDWADLYHALRQAAINLGWTSTDRANLERACLAVEIAVNTVDFASTCSQTGAPYCIAARGPFQTVGGAMANIATGTTVQIRSGTYPETILMNKQARLEAINGAVQIGP